MLRVSSRLHSQRFKVGSIPTREAKQLILNLEAMDKVTVFNLGLQFDNAYNVTMDPPMVRAMIEALNKTLSETFRDTQPQILGGLSLSDDQIEITNEQGEV